MADYPIKPILSLSKSVLSPNQLTELGADFSKDRVTAKLKGVTYYKSNFGQYIGLNLNELFITNNDQIVMDDDSRSNFRIKVQDGLTEDTPISDVTIGYRWDANHNDLDPYVYYFSDTIYSQVTSKPGTIYITIETPSNKTPLANNLSFTPLFNTSTSSLLDVISMSSKLLSAEILKILLEYMGLPDLNNAFIAGNLLISKYFDINNNPVLVVGNELTEEQIRYNRRCTWNTEYIRVTQRSNAIDHSVDPYVYYESDDKENNIHEYPLGGVDLMEVDSLIQDALLDLDILLEEVSEEFDELTESYEEVTEYGDVSDYISLKTLVKVTQIESTVIPKFSEIRLKHRIKRNGEDARVGTDWDWGKTAGIDPHLYYFTKNKYDQIERKIKAGDLLEISILYKITDNRRLPITWNNIDIRCNGIPTAQDKDPYVYFTDYTDNLIKLNFIEYGKDENGGFTDEVISKSPVTMDGYHITYGSLNEFSYNIRFEVTDSFIQLGNEFMVQVTEDSINLFPTYELISEYYIRSCKLLKLNDH